MSHALHAGIPYLTVVVTSRNDDHGGDLQRRTQFFINGLLAQAERVRLPMELVITEWNPPAGKPRLAESLEFPAVHPWLAVRIIEVPRAVHARYKHANALPLYQMIGKNVGIRRARGEFILCTNVDVLLSDGLMDYLATRPLSSGCSYRSPRHDTTFLQDAPELSPSLPLPQVLDLCRRHLLRVNTRDWSHNLRTGHVHRVYPEGATARELGRPVLFTNACGDFTLLSCKDFHCLRGYAEYDMFSFHLDSLFLHAAYYAGIQEVVLPESMPHYHIEHGAGWTPETHQAKTLDTHLDSHRIERLDNDALRQRIQALATGGTSIVENGEDWGLADLPLPVHVTTRANWEDKVAAPPAEAPRLSIVVTTRNDAHGGNMRQRFQAFLDHLGEVCDRKCLHAELIVVEWNPDPAFPPLRREMRWPRGRWLRVRIVTVPPELHRTFNHAEKLPLFQMIAKNVGLRRAAGQYVLVTNVDVLFSEELAAWLALGDIAEDAVYRIDRHDIGERLVPEGLDVPGRLLFCERNVVRVQGQHGTHSPGTILQGDPDKLHANACGDFTLMSRANWLALRGYPEFHLWSIYIDGLLLHAARATGLRQIILREPLRLYHIEHDAGWAVDKDPAARPCLDYRREYLPMCRSMLETRAPLDCNGPDWGLAGHALQEWTPGEANSRDTYRHWVEVLSHLDNRLYYRDQTFQSLNALESKARTFDPTVVVELGTLGGLSLRTWMRGAPDARIAAVDMSFETLRKSAEILPLDMARLTLLEQDILTVDFSTLWSAQDRVLFFIDAHDLPTVPIMRHVLEHGVPLLPAGSMVVVDDLWYSLERLTAEIAPAFLRGTVLPEIDELQCFEAHFAPYHGGGSFMGFREVVPLMEYLNCRGIRLHFDSQAKNAHFFVGPDAAPGNGGAGMSAEDTAAQSGVVLYNPLGDAVATDSAAAPAMRRIAAAYRRLGPGGTVPMLLDLVQQMPIPGVAYALAVCQARMGQPYEALALLDKVLALPEPQPQAVHLHADLVRKFLTHADDGRSRRPGLTLFASPKAFTGHIADIQRNAIESWRRLPGAPEIILFGEDPGVAEFAASLGLRHAPHPGCNDFGTPLVDMLFGTAQQLAETDVVAYVNADIVLFEDFARAVDLVRGQLPEFLMIGRRHDYNMHGCIDFSRSDWSARLLQEVGRHGSLHGEAGVDYFVFTPGVWSKIPPLALGRMAWDNWLVQAAFLHGKATVDASAVVTAVHQNHDYSHRPGGREAIMNGLEARRNRLLAGPLDFSRSFTNGTTHVLAQDGTLHASAPRPATFDTPQFQQARLLWLLKQCRRCLASGRRDLARAMLDEAVGMNLVDAGELQALRVAVAGE